MRFTRSLLMPETVYLADPQSPLQIEYPRAVMEKIRGLACDGLMALPRIGIGVGGLLLGVRNGSRVLVSGSIQVVCSHSAGPSFNLTGSEIDQVKALIATSRDLGVVGWYCSKPHADTALGVAQMALHKALFPDSEQVALMLQPSTVENTRAALFFRNEKGDIVKAKEWDVEEWLAPLEDAATTAPAMTNEPPEVKPESKVLVETAPTVAIKPIEIEAPAEKFTQAAPDLFAAYAPAPRRTGLYLRLLAAAAIIILGAAAFLTQEYWLPRPPLSLVSTESNGALVITWNVDALRGMDHASMSVNDGGNLHTMTLDRSALNQGFLRYTPKSERVAVRLSAGDTSAISAWLSRPKPAALPPKDAE